MDSRRFIRHGDLETRARSRVAHGIGRGGAESGKVSRKRACLAACRDGQAKQFAIADDNLVHVIEDEKATAIRQRTNRQFVAACSRTFFNRRLVQDKAFGQLQIELQGGNIAKAADTDRQSRLRPSLHFYRLDANRLTHRTDDYRHQCDDCCCYSLLHIVQNLFNKTVQSKNPRQSLRLCNTRKILAKQFASSRDSIIILAKSWFCTIPIDF